MNSSEHGLSRGSKKKKISKSSLAGTFLHSISSKGNFEQKVCNSNVSDSSVYDSAAEVAPTRNTNKNWPISDKKHQPKLTNQTTFICWLTLLASFLRPWFLSKTRLSLGESLLISLSFSLSEEVAELLDMLDALRFSDVRLFLAKPDALFWSCAMAGGQLADDTSVSLGKNDILF